MRWFRQKAGAGSRRGTDEPSESTPSAAAGNAEIDDTTSAGKESRADAEIVTESFADLHQRNEAFFDVEWYGLQVGASFTSRKEALAHAARWINENGHSPHPLYLPTWGRVQSGKTLHTHEESYRLFLTRGWTEQNPHPAVDLEHLSAVHPESLDDPDGVFGWLVKSLTEGKSLRPVPGEGKPLDWPEFRARQLAALSAQQEASARLPRWRALRATRNFDHDVEQAHFERLGSHTAPAPSAGPLVTVVMAAYNRARVIGDAIASVQAQTMQQWELIVVDDGSVDGTAQAAREHAASDPRISVVEQPHRGVSAARNQAIARSQGTWIAFLDTDTTWTPAYLEVMTATLTSEAAEHGYCAQRVDDGKAVSYRALSSADFIDIDNHIDLNVWMMRRDTLEVIGTFDESLHRAVDYDLIWRAIRHTPPLYVPVIGGHDSVQTAPGERIADTEPVGWRDVVRSKHIVDWDAPTARVAGVSAVVVWRGEPLRYLVHTLRHLGAPSSGADEVVVVGTGSHRQGTATVHAEAALSVKVSEATAPPLAFTPLLANIGFAATGRDKILFLRPGTTIPAEGIATLASAVDGGATVAQPVALDERGVILHAGLRFLDEEGRTVLPSPFLAEHLSEDLAGLPDQLESDGATLTSMITAAEDFSSVRGFDPLYGNFWFDADYAFRAAKRTGKRVVTCSRVQAEAVDRPSARVVAAMGAAALLLERHGRRGTRTASPWAGTPFEFHGLEFDGPDVEVNPFLVAPRPRLTLRNSEPAGHRLRVAIKHCAPGGERGKLWGDVYFAQDLANAFAERGHDVRVDNRDSIDRRTVQLDEVNIVVRGVRAMHPVPGAFNVLWIISHPDRVKPEHLVGFDLVYAASTAWAEIASARFGREIKPLLQATDPARFHPALRQDGLAPDILFVGNQRNDYRRPVAEGMALAAGEFDVGIYGGGWSREQYGPSVLRGEFLGNDELPTYYASAQVVMNDHFPTMRDYGIVNNRIFDALAAGTPVLTDTIPGARDIFGGRVLWYEQPEDIPAALRRYFADPWTDERRDEVARWAREHHSFDARVATILNDVAARRDGAQSALSGPSQ